MTLDGLLDGLAATELVELDTSRAHRVRPFESGARGCDIAGELVKNVGRGDYAYERSHEMRGDVVQRLQMINKDDQTTDGHIIERTHAREKRELLVLPFPSNLICIDRVPAVDARAGLVRRNGGAWVGKAGV